MLFAGLFAAVLAAGLEVVLVAVFLAEVAAVARLVAGAFAAAFAVDFAAGVFFAAGLRSVLAVAVRRVDLAAAAVLVFDGGRSTEMPRPLRWAIRPLR